MERRGPTFGTITTKSSIESMNFDVKLNRMAARTFSIPRSPECTSVSLYLDSLIFKEHNVEEEKITDDGLWFVVGNRGGGLMHDAFCWTIYAALLVSTATTGPGVEDCAANTLVGSSVIDDQVPLYLTTEAIEVNASDVEGGIVLSRRPSSGPLLQDPVSASTSQPSLK